MIKKNISDFKKVEDPQIIADIRAWAKDIVDYKNPKLKNLKICPYAIGALDDVIIVHSIYPEVFSIEEEFTKIMFITDLPWEVLTAYVEKLRDANPHLVFFIDHKSKPTYMNGVQTNLAKHSFIGCQFKSRLISGREGMSRTDWYKLWSQREWNNLTVARHITKPTDYDY